jgi:predicted porin
MSSDGFEGWGLNGGANPGAGRANRIGIKGSEDLGNGMKAIYQVEFGVQMTEEGDGNVVSGGDDNISMRNSFAGLTGGWGTFVVGRNDTPYKTSTGKLDLFADTMADNNGTVGFDDVRADNAIAYVSPNLSGFQLAAAVHAGGASTAGYGENLNSDSLAEAYSIAVSTATAPSTPRWPMNRSAASCTWTPPPATISSPRTTSRTTTPSGASAWA